MKQLIGTGLITLTNILDGRVEVLYSRTGEVIFENQEDRLEIVNKDDWKAPPINQSGYIYMIQRIGGPGNPWSEVIRMEGQAGISYKMRGTWRPGIEYTGACEYESNGSGKPVSPVILKGDIDLVIHEGSTFACMKTHMSDSNIFEQVPPSKKDVMEAQKQDPMPEVKNNYWVLTSMLGMQGPQGSAGPSGSDGKPSVNLVLSNENHSFSANAEGIIITDEKATTYAQVYIGTQEAADSDFTILYPQDNEVPPGLNLSWQVDDKGKGYLQITAIKNQSTLADSGSFSITARVKYGKDGNGNDLITVVKKDFSWTKVKNAESPYSIMVYSTNGNIFQKGTVNTTLKATIMHGEQDVSVKMKDKIVWYKITPTQEIKWAEKVLEIKIDPSQVNGQAVFACEVEV